MLILLPPSEGKHQPISGKTLKLNQLTFHQSLGQIRTTLLSQKIDQSKSRPAHEIYTGVLFQALNWGTLSAAAQKRGEKSILVISAVFGALRMSDNIPSYKAKIKTSVWKKALTATLENLEADLIVDCRSSTYAGVWTPDASKTVNVRVFQIKEGKRSVITHMSKKYRGELTRYLLQAGVSPMTPAEVMKIAAKYFDCELTKPDGKNPYYLDLLIEAG